MLDQLVGEKGKVNTILMNMNNLYQLYSVVMSRTVWWQCDYSDIVIMQGYTS